MALDATGARRATVRMVAFVAVALGHAVVTWPSRRVVALVLAGAALAGAAELLVVRGGLLVHRLPARAGGVPLVVLLAWPATVYVAYRLVALVLAGEAAVIGAAVLATAYDAVTEPFALREGWWAFPAHHASEPRLAGAPWWNAVGWFALTVATLLVTDAAVGL